MRFHDLPEALLARLFDGPQVRLGLGTSRDVRGVLLQHVSRLALRAPCDGSLASARALLARFAGQLESISLVGSALEPSRFAGVMSLPWAGRLVCLDVSRSQIWGKALLALANGIAAMPRLREVSLRGCHLGARGAAMLKHGICRNLSVRLLDLSENGIKDAGLPALADLLEVCPLQVLDVSGNSFSHEGLRTLLRGLVLGGTVSVLKLADNRLGARAGLLLAKERPLSSLPLSTFLANGNDLHSDALVAILGTLPVSTQILSLIGNRGSFAFGCELSRFLQRPGCALETLNCAWNELGDFGTQRLADGLVGCASRALRELDIDHNDVGDVGLLAVTEALAPFEALRTLRLGGNKTTPFFWQPSPSRAALWRRLEVLDLGFMAMRCEGAIVFAPALRGAAALRVLNLGGNGLKSPGMAAFADELSSLPALTHLALGGNHLGPEGGRALAHGLASCRRLQSLGLPWCMLGDAGVVALSAQLPACGALRDLDVSWNSVCGLGADALRVGLAACRTPPRVAVGGNSHMDAGGELLVAEFPDHVCDRIC